MNILEAFYYGNLHPETTLYEKTPLFNELIHLREKNKDELLHALNESGKEALEKFNDVQSELDDVTQFQKFSCGFKLGVLLMVEAFTGKDELTDS